MRIAVVDDAEIVVRGVAGMLSPYADQVEVADATHPRPRMDIALHDTFGCGAGGRAVLQRLLRDEHIARVVVFAWNFQPWMADEAIDLGASGYLSKSLTGAELVAALREVQQGRTVIAPAPAARPDGSSGWPGREEGLTMREAEVLTLITMGLSNAHIARRLGLSINSVKAYIRSGYRRIHAESRSQAVLWGVAHGLRARPQAGSDSLDATARRGIAQSE